MDQILHSVSLLAVACAALGLVMLCLLFDFVVVHRSVQCVLSIDDDSDCGRVPWKCF